MKELRLSESLNAIKNMNQNKFLNILKAIINENALIYLTNKQGSKGKPIKYSDMQMVEFV